MRLRTILIFVFSFLSAVLMQGTVWAAGKSVEEQVSDALIIEAGAGKIKAVVFDFTPVSEMTKTAEPQLKAQAAGVTDEFIAGILQRLTEAGKRDSIAIIDKSGLDEVLREKKITPESMSDRSAAEIGKLAGMDVVITGKVFVQGNTLAPIVKVVRTKDGEILAIARQEGQAPQEKMTAPAPANRASTPLLDKTERIRIGEWKSFPLSLSYTGMLSVAVNVEHGNPLEVYVMPASELDKFKKGLLFSTVSNMKPATTRHYNKTAAVASGEYYLVLRDGSTGVFSKESSQVKVNVQLAQ